MNLLRLVLILTLGCCLHLPQSLMAEDGVSPFAPNKQFSADQIISSSSGITLTSKVFADGGKIRTEMSMNGMQMISIVRPDLKKIYSVMVAQKMIMEMPYDSSKLKQQMGGAMQPDAKFETLGPDMVDGVACIKYKTTTPDSKVIFMWADATSKNPVKMAADDNSFSIVWKNYKAGPQDAALFEPPADYQKMPMPAMPSAAPAAAATGQ